MRHPDWAPYGLAEIWHMLGSENGRVSWSQYYAWQRMAQLCDDQAHALRTALDTLNRTWPPHPGSASQAMTDWVDTVIVSMRRSAATAATAARAISDITTTLDAARDKVANLIEQHHSYETAEQQWQPFLIPILGQPPIVTPDLPRPPPDWSADLDRQAQAVMAEADAAIGSHAARIDIPEPFAATSAPPTQATTTAPPSDAGHVPDLGYAMGLRHGAAPASFGPGSPHPPGADPPDPPAGSPTPAQSGGGPATDQSPVLGPGLGAAIGVGIGVGIGAGLVGSGGLGGGTGKVPGPRALANSASSPDARAGGAPAHASGHGRDPDTSTTRPTGSGGRPPATMSPTPTMPGAAVAGSMPAPGQSSAANTTMARGSSYVVSGIRRRLRSADSLASWQTTVGAATITSSRADPDHDPGPGVIGGRNR